MTPGLLRALALIGEGAQRIKEGVEQALAEATPEEFERAGIQVETVGPVGPNGCVHPQAALADRRTGTWICPDCDMQFVKQ